MMPKQKGFTLIELMVVLAIAAIMLGVVVPGFTAIISANQVEAQTNLMMSAIASARSEAVRANNDVTLCRSENKTACSNGDSWSDGWIIVDPNNNVFQSFKAAPEGYTFNTSANLSNSITFKASGELTTNGGTITICGRNQDTEDGYQISLNASGRARKEKGVLSC